MPNDLPDWAVNASLPGGSFTITVGQGTVTQNLPLPTHSPGVIVDVLTSGFAFVNVIGHTSGEFYIQTTTPASGQLVGLVTDSRDASVDLVMAVAAGQGNQSCDISFMPSGLVALIGGLVNVRLDPTPPLWQAPRAKAQAQVSAAGNTVLVAGSGNQIVRVFGWELETDQGTGFSIAFLNDSDALAAGRIAALVANNGQVSGNYQGVPLAIGKGLILEVAAIAAGGNVRAFVGYSQG